MLFYMMNFFRKITLSIKSGSDDYCLQSYKLET